MSLIIKSKTEGDLILITTSNDLIIKALTVNDLIITTKEMPEPIAETNYLLLEDGGSLLLEDGGKLILE